MARQSTKLASPTLAITRIETEEKTTDLRLRLKGKLAVDPGSTYLRAYDHRDQRRPTCGSDLDQLGSPAHCLGDLHAGRRSEASRPWRRAAPSGKAGGRLEPA